MTSGSMNLGDLNFSGSNTNTVTVLPAPTLSDLLKNYHPLNLQVVPLQLQNLDRVSDFHRNTLTRALAVRNAHARVMLI